MVRVPGLEEVAVDGELEVKLLQEIADKLNGLTKDQIKGEDGLR